MSRKITARVSDSEYATLERKIDASGITMSELIRQSLLHGQKTDAIALRTRIASQLCVLYTICGTEDDIKQLKEKLEKGMNEIWLSLE